jgi:hypothetical protein
VPDPVARFDRSAAWHFFMVRRGWAPLLVAVLLGALASLIGAYQAPVPAALETGTATVPLWRVLAMGAAVLPVLALHSPLADLEAAATVRQARMERDYLIGIACAVMVLYFSAAATTLHPLLLAIMLRSVPGWLGLALVSGRLFGSRLAWIGPLIAICVMTYWGNGSADGGYAWWEFSALPHDDLAGLLVSIGLLGIGVWFHWAAPQWRWRRRRLNPSETSASH